MNEESRLEALRRYRILDTPPESRFDLLAELAAQLLGTPVALVSFIDRDRQWSKARHGMGPDAGELPRDLAFCDHAIRQRDVLVITDMTGDPRFAENPLVAGGPKVRFYAGAPLTTPDGHNIGTLCVLDTKPREPATADLKKLAGLADMVMVELERNQALRARQEEIIRRQMSEAALRESERQFNALVANVPGVIYQWFQRTDGTCGFRYVSPRCEDIYGVTPAELLHNWQSLPIHPDDVERWRESTEQACKNRTDWSFEGRFILRDGSVRWWRGLSKPVEVGPDELLFYGIVIDITEEKAAAAALQETEQRFRDLAACAGDWFWEMDAEGRYLSFTDSFQEITGFDPAHVIGRTRAEILDPTKSAGEVDLIIQATARREPFRDVILPVRPAHHELRWVRTSGRPVFSAEGVFQGYRGAATDITRYRRQRQQLREVTKHSQLLAAAIEASSVGISILDGTRRDMAFIYVNAAFTRMTGYASEALLDRDCRLLLGADSDPEVAYEIGEALTAGRSLEAEIVYYRQDGTPFTAALHLAPVVDEDGRCVAHVMVCEDITVELERQAIERDEQRLMAIGELAGGIAHDFNNLLLVIDGYAWRALRHAADEAVVTKALGEVVKATDRAARLIKQLLVFSRRQIGERRVVRIADALTELEGLLRPLIGARHPLQLKLDDACAALCVETDPTELSQAIMNLATNARDAMPEGGPITIGLKPAVIDAALAARHPTLTAGPFVEIAIEDRGSGIDDATLNHIFDPFFTTKEQGKGTGLGLAMVYGFAQQSGGAVDVASEVGVGTNFRLYLPVVERAPTIDVSCLDEGHLGGGETVLLVEDDDALLRLSKSMLEELGYQVLTAPDGAQALEVEADYDGTIDLLISDVVMPSLGGFELAEIIQNTRPGIRTMFISGYPARGELKTVTIPEGVVFLQKPFKAEALARAVRRALAGDEASTNTEEKAIA